MFNHLTKYSEIVEFQGSLSFIMNEIKIIFINFGVSKRLNQSMF